MCVVCKSKVFVCSTVAMSSHISQWTCREGPACGGSACELTEDQLEGWTTSGTMVFLSPSLTGTKTSQVQTQAAARTPAGQIFCVFPHPGKQFLSIDSGDGACVAMTSGQVGGFWDDKQCSEKYAFICEKERTDISPPTQAPTPPPSQGCASGWTALPHFRHCYKVS